MHTNRIGELRLTDLDPVKIDLDRQGREGRHGNANLSRGQFIILCLLCKVVVDVQGQRIVFADDTIVVGLQSLLDLIGAAFRNKGVAYITVLGSYFGI